MGFSAPFSTDTLGFVVQEDDPRLAKMDSLWMLEQLASQQIEADTAKLNNWAYAADSIPAFTDTLIQYRLSKLDEQTPFNLVYNRAVETQIKIYANTYQFQKDVVVIIDPKSGAVEGVVDFSGLKEKVTQHQELNVFNGIAYHPVRKTFFVTGKNWDKLFEVKIFPKE